LQAHGKTPQPHFAEAIASHVAWITVKALHETIVQAELRKLHSLRRLPK
jgi:hypothetical protein